MNLPDYTASYSRTIRRPIIVISAKQVVTKLLQCHKTSEKSLSTNMGKPGNLLPKYAPSATFVLISKSFETVRRKGREVEGNYQLT